MQLLTDDDRATLPGIYDTEGQGDAAVCRVRFHIPGTYWAWYVIELDREDNDTIFGLAVGHEIEAGYFSLAELEENSPPVRRDAAWQPRPLGEARAAVEAERRPAPHVIDFTDREPGEPDPSGGKFGRCPACGQVGRVIRYEPEHAAFIHRLVEVTGGVYREDKCDIRHQPAAAPVWTWQRDGGEWRCIESGRRLSPELLETLLRGSRRLASRATGRRVYDILRYW